jgi:RNA polymerase sigma-70 factor (ECF subfamily)
LKLTDERARVVRAQRGDRRAFEGLFRDHHVRVYNLVTYLVGDRTQAEDVTQQAFVRAWEELPRLREPEAFAGWLNRIARNLAWDYVRSPASREQAEGLGGDEREPELDGAEPGADEPLVEKERDERVHSAIASLPEHQREVVVMHHLEGTPVQDVAARLGVPQGTVLSRLARARDALRRKLAPYVER